MVQPRRSFDTINFDQKWAALAAIARSADPYPILQHFVPDLAEHVSRETVDAYATLKEGLPKWQLPKGKIRADRMHLWVKLAMKSEKLAWRSSGDQDQDLIDFYGLPFEQWISKLAEKHHEVAGSVLADNDGAEERRELNDDTITVVVDPNDHSLDDYSSFEKEGMIDQKFMYLSPQSVHHWRDITGKKRGYPTYDLCFETLRKTLAHPSLSGMTYPIILGAGAPIKEEAIFKKAISNSKGGTPHAACFDASFYMLMSSFRENKDLIDKVQFDLYCMDILNIRSWMRFVRLKDHERVFFLLGETVGNLHEKEMFQSFDYVMQPGDKLIIGGEFFENQEQIELELEALTKRYEDESVIDLVLGHLVSMSSPTFDSITPIDRRELVDIVPIKSSDIRENVRLQSDIPGTYSICFRTNRNIVVARDVLHSGLMLGSSKRYVRKNFISIFCEKTNCRHLATIPHPKKGRYDHLIFEKKYAPCFQMSLRITRMAVF